MALRLYWLISRDADQAARRQTKEKHLEANMDEKVMSVAVGDKTMMIFDIMTSLEVLSISATLPALPKG